MQSEPRFPVFSAYARTMKYNLGSICFGGFIIALVQFIRACVSYAEYRLKQANQDSRMVKAVLCVMKSYLWCMEKCMKAISQNAYIWVRGSNAVQRCRGIAMGALPRRSGDSALPHRGPR